MILPEVFLQKSEKQYAFMINFTRKNRKRNLQKELANAPQPRYNALKRESLQEGNSKDKDNIEGGKQNGPGIRTDGEII